MQIRFGENPQTQCAGIEPFANGGAVGWVAKSKWLILPPAHHREKSALDSVDASIHLSRRLTTAFVITIDR
jgi:hypothetical protein